MTIVTALHHIHRYNVPSVTVCDSDSVSEFSHSMINLKYRVHIYTYIKKTADRVARAAGTVYRVVAGTESLDGSTNVAGGGTSGTATAAATAAAAAATTKAAGDDDDSDDDFKNSSIEDNVSLLIYSDLSARNCHHDSVRLIPHQSTPIECPTNCKHNLNPPVLFPLPSRCFELESL